MNPTQILNSYQTVASHWNHFDFQLRCIEKRLISIDTNRLKINLFESGIFNPNESDPSFGFIPNSGFQSESFRLSITLYRKAVNFDRYESVKNHSDTIRDFQFELIYITPRLPIWIISTKDWVGLAQSRTE